MCNSLKIALKRDQVATCYSFHLLMEEGRNSEENFLTSSVFTYSLSSLALAQSVFQLLAAFH